MVRYYVSFFSSRKEYDTREFIFHNFFFFQCSASLKLLILIITFSFSSGRTYVKYAQDDRVKFLILEISFTECRKMADVLFLIRSPTRHRCSISALSLSV